MVVRVDTVNRWCCMRCPDARQFPADRPHSAPCARLPLFRPDSNGYIDARLRSLDDGSRPDDAAAFIRQAIVYNIEAKNGRSQAVRANLTILLLTVVLTVVYLYGTTQIPTLEIGDPLGPKAFPNLIGIAMLVAAGMLAFEIWRDKVKNAPQERLDLQPKVVLVLLAVAAWTGIYYLCFVSAGYVIATSVYLLPLMAYFHPRKWVANVASAVLFSVLTYWMFVKLDVNLPKGPLPF